MYLKFERDWVKKNSLCFIGSLFRHASWREWKETFYGVYKQANEHTAYVYNADLQIPSIGIRPNIVYGLTRDQGVSSKNTIAFNQRH